MSYVLFFQPGNRDLPSDEEVMEHFRRRRNYSVDDAFAGYKNEDTGVSFTFDLEGRNDSPGCFTINYNRSSIFGWEAQVEVAAYVEAFGLKVDDPQTDGMGKGAYSKEGFLRGWNAGNRFGCLAVCLEHRWSPPTLPTAQLERIWRWNYTRDDFQAHIASRCSCFVPKQSLLVLGSEPQQIQSFVVWGDGDPIVIPKDVDLLILYLAEGPKIVRRAQLDALLEKHPERKGEGLREGLRWYELAYERGPAPLVDHLIEQPSILEKPQLVSFEDAFDEDLVTAVNTPSTSSQNEISEGDLLSTNQLAQALFGSTAG